MRRGWNERGSRRYLHHPRGTPLNGIVAFEMNVVCLWDVVNKLAVGLVFANARFPLFRSFGLAMIQRSRVPAFFPALSLGIQIFAILPNGPFVRNAAKRRHFGNIH